MSLLRWVCRDLGVTEQQLIAAVPAAIVLVLLVGAFLAVTGVVFPLLPNPPKP